MSWDRDIKINDNLGFGIDTGSFDSIFSDDEYFKGHRVCIPIQKFLEMNSKDIKQIKDWLKKYSSELIAIGTASECNWRDSARQFLDVEDILLIINGTMASEEQKDIAKGWLRSK